MGTWNYSQWVVQSVYAAEHLPLFGDEANRYCPCVAIYVQSSWLCVALAHHNLGVKSSQQPHIMGF
jgi:hypothetical protein